MARTRKNRRGGGYGFAGSLMGASESNGGNQRWEADTGKDCGATANRGGNGTFGGKRRKSRRVGGKRRRGGNLTLNRGGNGGGRRRKGGARGGNGNPDLAQNIPRTNYSFQGDGSAGMVNWAPDSY